MAWPASRVSRVVMTGPLAPFAGVYELELRRRRYTPLAVVNQLRQVARLSHWLETNGLAVAALTGERVEEFLALQRASGRYRAQWSRPGLLCLPRCPPPRRPTTASPGCSSWAGPDSATRTAGNALRTSGCARTARSSASTTSPCSSTGWPTAG